MGLCALALKDFDGAMMLVRDLVRNVFQFKRFLAMKLTTQHDLYQ